MPRPFIPSAKRSYRAKWWTDNQIAERPPVSQSRGRATNSLWGRDWVRASCFVRHCLPKVRSSSKYKLSLLQVQKLMVSSFSTPPPSLPRIRFGSFPNNHFQISVTYEDTLSFTLVESFYQIKGIHTAQGRGWISIVIKILPRSYAFVINNRQIAWTNQVRDIITKAQDRGSIFFTMEILRRPCAVVINNIENSIAWTNQDHDICPFNYSTVCGSVISV